MVNHKVSGYVSNVASFVNERDEILITDFPILIEKIEELCLLAISAYESDFENFALDTFVLTFGLLSKPYDFYECGALLRALNQTNFVFLSDQLCAIEYDISENFKRDLTDKLLLKLKMFEFSNVEFAEKLNKDILEILFNHRGEYRINQSLSDSLSFFMIYLIKNNSIGIAKSILIDFREYLIQIVEGVIFENRQMDSLVQLKEFCQTISSDEIGNDNYNELKILISKL